MGRRDAVEKKVRRAGDLARHLRSVRRMEGVLWVEPGALWLLSRIPSKPAHPYGLADALLRDRLPERARLARLLGAQEIVRIEAAQLTAWARAVAELESNRDLVELVKEGVRPLRGYRGSDFLPTIQRASRRLEHFRRMLDHVTLGDYAGLSRQALANWQFDPRNTDGIESLDRQIQLSDIFRHFPARAMALPLRAAQRSAILYGPLRAMTLLEKLAQPLLALAKDNERLQRFVAVVQAFADGQRIVPQNEAEVVLREALATFPAAAADRARLLARLFLHGLGNPVGSARLVPRRPLERIARAAMACGLPAAARALGEAWKKAARDAALVTPVASHVWQKVCLAVDLQFPEADLSIPPELTEETLTHLAKLLTPLPPWRVRELWPLLTRDDCQSKLEQRWLAESDLSVELLDRAVRLKVVWAITRFKGKPKQLARYLACIEQLQAQAIPELDLEAAWFADLFRSGRSWTPAVALVLLKSTLHKESRRPDPAALYALSRTLSPTGPFADSREEIAAALDEWNTVRVQRPPLELAVLVEQCHLERGELEQYLHHRRLAGHDESFAQALLKPLQRPQQEAQESAFLTAQLASDNPNIPVKDHRATRLARLTDPDLAAERRRQDARRVRNQLFRSLERLKEESLERVLDGIFRRHLQRLLGEAPPAGRLPPGLWEALHLLNADDINHDLLVSFLKDVLRRQPRALRPVNRAWLAKAVAAGIDTPGWLEGFRCTVAVAGEPITFATERDPLAVLKMGSYFDTCLSLEGGCHASSTLLNALDVNKHVIYGRRSTGAVAARKLIGATRRGELAGFYTYAVLDKDETRRMLNGVLADFAARCNLRLSDHAVPEILHDGFWYNDGNEPWLPAVN